MVSHGDEHSVKFCSTNSKDGQVKQLQGREIYEWAIYELNSARRVEQTTGIDTSDLRQQVVYALQQDLYDWLGDKLTI